MVWFHHNEEKVSKEIKILKNNGKVNLHLIQRATLSQYATGTHDTLSQMSLQKIGIGVGAQPYTPYTTLRPQNTNSTQRQYRKQKMVTKMHSFIPDSKIKVIMTATGLFMITMNTLL